MSGKIMINLIARLMVFITLASLPGILLAARPFIVDTDAAIDDAIAILYLSNRSEIDIKAISIVATGEAHCKPALKNISGILALANKKDIPIACGDTHPLAGNHRFPAWLTKSADTLYGMAATLPKQNIHAGASATELLKRTLMDSKEPVNILALGPLTNLANLLSRNPELAANIKMIYIMGGAVDVPGNVGDSDEIKDNKTAEWNFFIDPVAAAAVVKSGVPITLVSLDVTNQVPITDTFFKQLYAEPRLARSSKFIYQLFSKHKKDFLTQGWYLWDPLAAVISTDESFATFKIEKVRIATEPERLAGSIIKDTNGNAIRICSTVKADNATQLVLDTLMR